MPVPTQSTCQNDADIINASYETLLIEYGTFPPSTAFAGGVLMLTELDVAQRHIFPFFCALVVTGGTWLNLPSNLQLFLFFDLLAQWVSGGLQL